MKTTDEILTIESCKPIVSSAEKPGTVFFDLMSTGRFWRSSHITDLTVILPSPSSTALPASSSSSPPASSGGNWRRLHFEAKDEPEEFEILSALPSLLPAGMTELVTFNGHTFDLPYLNHKLRAYGLANPFGALRHRDLMTDLKPMMTLLGLPSYRLQDFMTFFGPDNRSALPCDDASALLRLMLLDSYLAFYRGEGQYVRAWSEADFLFYELKLPSAVPKPVSGRDGVLHVRFEGDTVRIASPVIGGRLHLYMTDYKSYDYLPREGYAVHKSLSRFVELSHREPAQRETAFTLVSFDDTFLGNEKRLKSYLASLCAYLSTPFTRHEQTDV